MNANRLMSLIGALVLIIGMPAAVHAESWGPWSVSSSAPVLLTPMDRQLHRVQSSGSDSSVIATPFIWLLRFYQGFISPVDGDRCVMYPTCSQYSVQAIRKHGPLVGIIMTCDRLIHEADEQHISPLIKVGNRYRYADPVENNDFWWNK